MSSAYVVRTVRLGNHGARVRTFDCGSFETALALFLRHQADSMVERVDLIADWSGQHADSPKAHAAWLGEPDA